MLRIALDSMKFSNEIITMIFQLSFSEKMLLDSNAKKRPYKLLVLPAFMLILSGLVINMLAPAIWPHLKDFRYLTPEIFSENRAEISKLLSLILAAVVLTLGILVMTWRAVKSAIRTWQITSTPTAKDYGLVDGLHFGDGTVEVSDKGISLKRKLYSAKMRWASVECGFQNENLIGIVQKDGQKLHFGKPDTEEQASEFVRMVHAHTGAQDED